MVDPVSVTALALNSFATMRQVAKSFSELKTDIATQGKVIELQAAILTAQDAALQMQQAIAEERDKVQELKAALQARDDWGSTIEKYELVDAGLGKRLFRLKAGKNPHFICPNCVVARMESILQTTGWQSESQWCPRCNSTFQTKPHHD